MKIYPVLILCPDCDGSGKLRKNTWDAVAKTYTFGSIPCYYCKGEGAIVSRFCKEMKRGGY